MGKPFPTKVDRESLSPNSSDDRSVAGAINLLQKGDITSCVLLPRGSNAVFLLSLKSDGKSAKAIYKPQRGEAPLWDFPDGTLYRRELASYMVSQALGWHIVPPTVVRGGPYGVGAVQWFVSATGPSTDYNTLVDTYEGDMKRIAVFDWLVNNADRKVGHCLRGVDGRIWGVDHGLTFNVAPKLRTVIWDFSGQRVPGQLVADLQSLQKRLRKGDALIGGLSRLLATEEVQAFGYRLGMILKRPFFPAWSGSYRSVPWPPF